MKGMDRCEYGIETEMNNTIREKEAKITDSSRVIEINRLIYPYSFLIELHIFNAILYFMNNYR